jgi:hypothetical protein
MRNWPLGSLMLVLASACGPTTGAEGKSGGPEVGSEATTATASTAGAATGTTAHGEATKAAGTESTETSDGTSGGPTGACENPAFPVTVPLCGDEGPPCQVIADEPIAATPAIRGDTPALALRGDCSPVVTIPLAFRRDRADHCPPRSGGLRADHRRRGDRPLRQRETRHRGAPLRDAGAPRRSDRSRRGQVRDLGPGLLSAGSGCRPRAGRNQGRGHPSGSTVR